MLPDVAQAQKTAFHNISPNGECGDWYWEVNCGGDIIARGLAATERLARADAMRATLSYVDPRPENLPPYLEDPSSSLPPASPLAGRVHRRRPN